jgi:hypothetical protein
MYGVVHSKFYTKIPSIGKWRPETVVEYVEQSSIYEVVIFNSAFSPILYPSHLILQILGQTFLYDTLYIQWYVFHVCTVTQKTVSMFDKFDLLLK